MVTILHNTLRGLTRPGDATQNAADYRNVGKNFANIKPDSTYILKRLFNYVSQIMLK